MFDASSLVLRHAVIDERKERRFALPVRQPMNTVLDYARFVSDAISTWLFPSNKSTDSKVERESIGSISQMIRSFETWGWEWTWVHSFVAMNTHSIVTFVFISATSKIVSSRFTWSATEQGWWIPAAEGNTFSLSCISTEDCAQCLKDLQCHQGHHFCIVGHRNSSDC